MTPRLKSTRAARDLIKAHEPFLATAERRGKRWVVGYGHTAAAKEGVELKPEDAELLLIYDVMRAEQTLDASVGAEMAAPMRDALVSFALSVGLRAFKVSDVARLARDGRHREAAAAIETWVRADQDGRLVVSDRLVARRAAEKALYLTALEDSAAVIDTPATPVKAAPEPVTEPQAAGEPAPVAVEAEVEAPVVEEPEAEAEDEPLAADEGPSEPVADTPALVELDIAFELPDEDEAAHPIERVALDEIEPDAEPVDAPEPSADADSTDAEGDADTVAEADGAAEGAEDAVELAPETEVEDVAEPSVESAQVEAASEEPAPLVVTEEDDTESEAVKAAQDAAITQVMARMAKQVSASIAAAPVETAEETTQLGYSFLSTAHVGLDSPRASDPIEDAPEPQVRPNPASSSLFSAPSVPLSPLQSALQMSSIKVTPIAPESLPQAASSDAEVSGRPAELADKEDALSVEVSEDVEGETDAAITEDAQPSGLQVFSAPPHPALAPASAPGLSGDIEGPDHPDKDVDEPHQEIHEDIEVLDPAVVSGGETAGLDDPEPSQRRGGNVMFISSLALGGVMVGLGGWDIAANMDAYMELGLAYSPLGPTVFGAGVLLSAASAWFIIGRRNEK